MDHSGTGPDVPQAEDSHRSEARHNALKQRDLGAAFGKHELPQWVVSCRSPTATRGQKRTLAGEPEGANRRQMEQAIHSAWPGLSTDGCGGVL